MQQKILTIVILTLLLACNSNKAKEETEKTEVKAEIATSETTVSLTSEQLKNAGIATAKPEMQYISSTLKVSGQIDVPPQNMVTVSVPMGGYLVNTRLLPGMSVGKGQVIAVVQDQQYIQMQQD